jgi:orotate phosphoribosyltransferase
LSFPRKREAGVFEETGSEKNSDMNVEQVLKEFKKAGALLEGHFILSSGLHSDRFLQKALVFQDARRTAKLCKALAAKVRQQVKGEITAIVSPAVGGIVPGYEMGRQLGLPAMYVERVDGVFQLRRNFTLKKGQRVLMVEDIVSTGVSSRECIAAIRKTGAKVVAACCLIDRSAGKAKVGVPLIALAQWKVSAWPADKLPAHLKDIPAVKPGSRGLA